MTQLVNVHATTCLKEIEKASKNGIKNLLDAKVNTLKSEQKAESTPQITVKALVGIEESGTEKLDSKKEAFIKTNGVSGHKRTYVDFSAQ